ncbi:MAG: hypothetical protein V4584_05735 [Verrucomicrobiota bacterium]
MNKSSTKSGSGPDPESSTTPTPSTTHRAPPLLTHLELSEAYTVMEIATLAAACAGETHEAKFMEAVKLLSFVTGKARQGKWGIEIEDRIRQGEQEWASPEVIAAEKENQDQFDKKLALADRLCASADRHKTSKRILRNDLVLEICKSAGTRIEKVEQANRKFTAWLKHAAVYRADQLTVESMHTSSPFIMWDDPNEESKRLNKPPASEQELAEFLSRFESGRPAQIHDEQIAKRFVLELIHWLEFQPKTAPRQRLRSNEEGNEGQFVPGKVK